MFRHAPIQGIFFTLVLGPVHAAPPAFKPAKIEFQFADVETSRALLATEDIYTNAMSPFDRKVRMSAQQDPGTKNYMKFVASQAQTWSPEAIEAVNQAIDALKDPLASLGIKLNAPVSLIHTTGREEAGAAYTRGNEIILPPQETGTKSNPPTRLLAHELFHVISRQHPELRDQLYEMIGFEKANPIQLPANITHLRITNPDAPIIEHVMRLKLSPETSVTVAPILIAKTDYQADRKQGLFGYLSFKLMQVKETPDGWIAEISDQNPIYHSPQTPDFKRQIGRNTGYIIHPEEILADNFALLITDGKITDEWVTDQMRAEIKTYFDDSTKSN
jgi:hypothetical protein